MEIYIRQLVTLPFLLSNRLKSILIIICSCSIHSREREKNRNKMRNTERKPRGQRDIRIKIIVYYIECNFRLGARSHIEFIDIISVVAEFADLNSSISIPMNMSDNNQNEYVQCVYLCVCTCHCLCFHCDIENTQVIQ